MNAILARYADMPGDRKLVFQRLCALVGGETTLGVDAGGINWAGFGAAEWALFEKMALEEQVAPLAFYRLKTQPDVTRRTDFNPETYQALSRSEAISALHNAVLFKQLKGVLRALEQVQVPVVLLKGADLARWLYPEVGLRVMTDVDLLVAQEHFEQALRVVQGLGFQEFLPEAGPGLNRLLSYHAHMRKDGRVAVLLELHWTLVGTPAYRYAVPVDWFWQNVEPAELPELPDGSSGVVYRLNPDANLLYLAAHQMLQHGGQYALLRWLLDLHLLVSKRWEDINWPVLAAQAGAFGWGVALRSALEAMQATFSTRLPEGYTASLPAQEGEIDALVALKEELAPTRTLHELKNLSALHGWARLRQFLALLAPGGAYMRWRYRPQPGWSWPLYYLVRWWDITGDVLRTLKEASRRGNSRG